MGKKPIFSNAFFQKLQNDKPMENEHIQQFVALLVRGRTTAPRNFSSSRSIVICVQVRLLIKADVLKETVIKDPQMQKRVSADDLFSVILAYDNALASCLG